VSEMPEQGAPARPMSGGRIVVVFLLLILVAVLIGLGIWRYNATRAARLADEAALCELMILDLLKAPSSYRRIDAFQSEASDPASKLPTVEAYVTYEAANPMGVRLRSRAHCEFWRHSGSAGSRLKQAEIDGEPIADESMLTVLAISADLDLMKLRARERTPWGMLGF
jgi:hypothetical protein